MYIDCWLYSKTCLKQPLKKEDQLSLNAGQKYCRMLQDHFAIFSTFIKLPNVIKIFVLSFLSGCLRHILLYWLPTCTFCRLSVRWIFLLKWDFLTTKMDGSTGPTALESDGPYFEIMGQWPGPTINLKACPFKQGPVFVLAAQAGLPARFWVNHLIRPTDPKINPTAFISLLFSWRGWIVQVSNFLCTFEICKVHKCFYVLWFP